MKLFPILALVIGTGMMLFGGALEGLDLWDIVQAPAFLIVVGGTLGATWLGATPTEAKDMSKLFVRVFRREQDHRPHVLQTLVRVSGIVRRDGMLAVERLLPEIKDPFLRNGLQLLVDGQAGDDVRKLLELEADIDEDRKKAGAQVMTDAGGYSPTIGLVGAVMGLIHTMAYVDDPQKAGAGIAVAFVATIYGIAFANLYFLPLGKRMKKIGEQDAELKAMIITGLEIITSGASPRQLEETLAPYVRDAEGQEKEAA